MERMLKSETYADHVIEFHKSDRFVNAFIYLNGKSHGATAGHPNKEAAFEAAKRYIDADEHGKAQEQTRKYLDRYGRCSGCGYSKQYCKCSAKQMKQYQKGNYWNTKEFLKKARDPGNDFTISADGKRKKAFINYMPDTGRMYVKSGQNEEYLDKSEIPRFIREKKIR